MSSSIKKTLFFALEDVQDLSKIEKNVILENVPLTPVLPKVDANKRYNIVNIKLLPLDEGVLELDFDELEEMLSSQAQEYKQAFLKKYPHSVCLTGTDVQKLIEYTEQEREARMTSHLNEEQKMVRAELFAFKKHLNLQGPESSFITNIFDDVITLNLIDENTPISKQKKSVNTIFTDRKYIIDLVIQKIEDLQSKIVSHRQIIKGESSTESEPFVLDIARVWPDWKQIAKEKQVQEEHAQVVAQEQKRGRGRPKKHAF